MSFSYLLCVIDEGGETVLDHELSADEAVRIIAGAMSKLKNGAQAEEPDEKPTRRGRKKRRKEETGNEKWQDLREQEGKQRGKVSEEAKKEVEDLFVEGKSVIEVAEKFATRLGVSTGWFYMIRARLKKEGRLQ